MSSAVAASMGATILGSMMAGAGFWLSSPAHRQEIHLKERVKELEAQLGPNFQKHKHHIEEFFGMEHHEEDDLLTRGGGAGKGGSYSKLLIVLFFVFDAIVILVAMWFPGSWAYRMIHTTKPMHGKGKLKLHVDCLRYLPVQKPDPKNPHAPAKNYTFTPTVKVNFGKFAETLINEKVTVDPKTHMPNDRHDVRLATKQVMEVDFDFEDPKVTKDALPSKRFPKRFFTLSVHAKTESETKDLGSQEVDIAELVDKSVYTVHLGGVQETGICHRKSGKFGEVIITPEWTWTEHK